MGFQNERRDLWEAPNVYLDMSPFLKANQLTGALLMYHGLATRTSAPIRSIRSAVQRAERPRQDGGALLLPLRRSRPGGRETLLDLWSRWAAWLDKYVKNPQPPNKPTPTPTPGGGRGGR
jgi:hypothetical protein